MFSITKIAKINKILNFFVIFFVLFTISFVFFTEDIGKYLTTLSIKEFNNTKLVSLHLIANILLAVSTLFISIIHFKIYLNLRDKKIPFIGFMWIFGSLFLGISMIYFMNLINVWRLYYWLDGLIRVVAGWFALASLIAFKGAYKYIIGFKSPEEYGRLADELHYLREENEKLKTILNKK